MEVQKNVKEEIEMQEFTKVGLDTERGAKNGNRKKRHFQQLGLQIKIQIIGLPNID